MWGYILFVHQSASLLRSCDKKKGIPVHVFDRILNICCKFLLLFSAFCHGARTAQCSITSLVSIYNVSLLEDLFCYTYSCSDEPRAKMFYFL